MATTTSVAFLHTHAHASLSKPIAQRTTGLHSHEPCVPSQLSSVKFLSGCDSFPNAKLTTTSASSGSLCVPGVFPTEKRGLRVVAGGPGLAGEQDQGQQGSSDDFPPVPSGRMMVPMMKKGYGAFGGGGATLEKSKLDLSFSATKTTPQIDLGGGGGNVGKGGAHGGGDGGDDGGDDDDYFGEDDGDDGDDDGFIRRAIISEVFDRASVEAVLQEWFRSMADLPAGIRRAVEMGLVSSAQIARFMSIDARPTIARIVSRATPAEVSRAFVGRMMADPAFIYKLLLEQAVTVGTSAWWEVKQRGDRLKDEWGLALTNVLTLSLCNAAVVWSLSPTRSYGSTATSEWQMALQKLPNNMFDKSYPLREFNLPARAGSFFFNAAKLSLVGSTVGALGGLASNAILSAVSKGKEGFRPSVVVPSASTSAAAYGAHTGLSGNLRYQLLYGLDRMLQQHFNHIPVAVLGTTALRCGNVLLGEPSRLMWLGMDGEAQQQAKAEQQAYRRPSRSSGAGSKTNSFLQSLPIGKKSEEAQPKKKSAARRVTKAAAAGGAESGADGGAVSPAGAEKVQGTGGAARTTKRKAEMAAAASVGFSNSSSGGGSGGGEHKEKDTWTSRRSAFRLPFLSAIPDSPLDPSSLLSSPTVTSPSASTAATAAAGAAEVIAESLSSASFIRRRAHQEADGGGGDYNARQKHLDAYTADDDEATVRRRLAAEGLELRDLVPHGRMSAWHVAIVFVYHMLPYTPLPCTLAMLACFYGYRAYGWQGAVVVVLLLLFLRLIPLYYNSAWRRKLTFLYEAMARYMTRVRVIVPAQQVPRGGYLFTAHPHGRMFYSSSMLTQTAHLWKDTFCPHGELFGAANSTFFEVPVIRSMLYMAGAIPASRGSIIAKLRHGDHVGIVVGGIREVCLGTNPHTDVLYLMRRRGFARIAVEEKVGVVPMYCFNETQLFKHDPLWLLQFWAVVNRYWRIGVPFMRGVCHMPMPFRRELLIVVGKPLFARDGETVDEFHARYVDEISLLPETSIHCMNPLDLFLSSPHTHFLPSLSARDQMLSDNPDGWGPTTLPEQFKDVPYAPFNKGDRVGRAADWTSQGYRRYDRDRQGGAGGVNAAFSFFQDQDEDSFQLVDTKPVQKPRYGPRRFFQNRFQNRRGEEGKRDGRDSGAGADRERQRQQRMQQQKRGQWNPYYDRNAQRATYNSSVDIRPEWVVLEQIPLSALSKLSFNAGEPQDVTTCGALEYYDKMFDRVNPKSERPLERCETRQFHKVTTSDDPVVKRLAAEGGDAPAVFATDAILSTLMCAPRSVYSWDVVVHKSGGKLFFDQRDSSFDLLTVNETATGIEPAAEDSINGIASLSQEATFINQNFSQQIVNKKGAKRQFAEANPFAAEGEEVASVAYRYRKWMLDGDMPLVVRCELDAVVDMRGQEMLATVNALNEFDPKVTGVDWRAKIDNQRGAVLATELKNNSNKLAKWTAQALLAGADLMKLGYVSRVFPKNNLKHTILAVQAYKPRELAMQITLSSTNMWGIVKHIVDMCMKLGDGKYLIVKDPNKPFLRLYEVPSDAFDNDYVEEPLAEEDQAPPPPDAADGDAEAAAASDSTAAA
ncbi:unnamed protein product [Closterium sp. NIES-53]